MMTPAEMAAMIRLLGWFLAVAFLCIFWLALKLGSTVRQLNHTTRRADVAWIEVVSERVSLAHHRIETLRYATGKSRTGCMACDIHPCDCRVCRQHPVLHTCGDGG